MSVAEAPVRSVRTGALLSPGVEDRVVDRVAAWAPDLAAQAEVLTALFGNETGQETPPPPVGQRAECGTYRAYKQHLKYGEETCDRCRAANAERARAGRKARGRQTRRARPANRPHPECGTNAAYYQHVYYGEFPIDPDCRAAHSAAETAAEARRRAKR